MRNILTIKLKTHLIPLYSILLQSTPATGSDVSRNTGGDHLSVSILCPIFCWSLQLTVKKKRVPTSVFKTHTFLIDKIFLRFISLEFKTALINAGQ